MPDTGCWHDTTIYWALAASDEQITSGSCQTHALADSLILKCTERYDGVVTVSLTLEAACLPDC
jgi:hypothetical protein